MERIDPRLKKVFQSYPAIQAVYLFGSRATGKTHPGSDLDIAIVPGDNGVRNQKLNILTDLARLGIDNIDLVFLDTEDLVLKYEAVKHNHLIYQKEPFSRGEMYSKVVRQYLDFEPYLKVQREAYKRRLCNDNKEVIRKRLNKIDTYLNILYKSQKYSFDAFIADPERYGSVERFLHLAIEALNDIGNHIIADDALGMVDSYSDIPTILAEKGFIKKAQRESWIMMIGFRNTLVHDYIDIDRKIVYQVLQENLGDIEALVRVFANFM
jgi:uncharacterized protein YutE (UPF0331/DUF86 family)/predicted nucleotidyltransferase